MSDNGDINARTAGSGFTVGLTGGIGSGDVSAGAAGLRGPGTAEGYG